MNFVNGTLWYHAMKSTISQNLVKNSSSSVCWLKVVKMVKGEILMQISNFYNFLVFLNILDLESDIGWSQSH